jgi:hypothetical protein
MGTARKKIWPAFFLFLAGLWAVPAWAADGNRFALKISGGIGRYALGDINSYLEGSSQFRKDSLQAAGYIADREFESFHGGREFAISAWIPVSRHVHVILASGYIRVEKNRNGLNLNSSFSTLTNTFDHSISAFPLTLGLGCTWPVSGRFVFYVFSGGGIYFTKFAETGEAKLVLMSGLPGYASSWEADTKAAGLGCFGGFGLELGVTGNISFIAEAGGRFAKISGFSGGSRFTFNNSASEENFDLYYYEFLTSDLKKPYKALSLPNAERGYPLKEFRNGVIDLSGFSLRAGIKFIL